MLRQSNDALACGATRLSALGQQRTMGSSIVTPVRPNSAYPRTLPSLIELFLGGPCGRYFVPREIKNANDEQSYYYDCHHLNPPVKHSEGFVERPFTWISFTDLETVDCDDNHILHRPRLAGLRSSELPGGAMKVGHEPSHN